MTCMYSADQMKMIEATANELERQMIRIDAELNRFSDDFKESSGFDAVGKAIIMHNAKLGDVLKLIESAHATHPAVWEFAFDGLCHAFSLVMERFADLKHRPIRSGNPNTGFKDFLEDKLKAHTKAQNIDAPCEIVKECTKGKCNTLKEAFELAHKNGLRVIHKRS